MELNDICWISPSERLPEKNQKVIGLFYSYDPDMTFVKETFREEIELKAYIGMTKCLGWIPKKEVPKEILKELPTVL